MLLIVTNFIYVISLLRLLITLCINYCCYGSAIVLKFTCREELLPDSLQVAIALLLGTTTECVPSIHNVKPDNN